MLTEELLINLLNFQFFETGGCSLAMSKVLRKRNLL